jgi:glycogen synthase
MAWRLGCTSIFVAPARYEPFGLAILEAAAAGCALVLGDIPSLRENWGGAAVFVDLEDRSALKSAINDLIANPGGRGRVATVVQCRAREFTLLRMARAYAALYREMAPTSARLEIA